MVWKCKNVAYGVLTDLRVERRDYDFKYEEIETPVMIRVGEMDEGRDINNPEFSEFIHALLPNSEFHIDPGLDHEGTNTMSYLLKLFGELTGSGPPMSPRNPGDAAPGALA